MAPVDSIWRLSSTLGAIVNKKREEVACILKQEMCLAMLKSMHISVLKNSNELFDSHCIKMILS